jgi:hypothetical protein
MIPQLIFLLLASLVSAEYSRYIAMDSSTFTQDVAHLISGTVSSQEIGSVSQIVNLGHDISLTQGYTMTNLTLATTLTFAWCVRDSTAKPNVTLTDVYLAVVASKCIGSVTSTIISATAVGGNAAYPSKSPYKIGSSDSYSNVFAVNDVLTLDFASYFSSLTLNQAATINIWAQADLFVVF